MTCGIYSITNARNGKRYVGSAKSISKRWQEHLKHLRGGTHPSRHLMNAWQKYGEKVFRFEILATCEPEELLQLEQFWIDAFQAADRRHGYNSSPTAGNSLGVKFSPETKAKLSALAIGRKPSAETKAKLSESRRGKKRSDETKAKISAGARATLARSEVQAKLSAAQRGRKRSAETLARMSTAAREQMARPGMRENLSAKLTGFQHTLDTRRRVSAGVKAAQARPGAKDKMAEARRGKKRSEATKAKMSESAKLNPGAKLNEDSVRQIRKLLADGAMVVEIAEMFGVSTACIGHVRTGKNWSHVK